MINVTSFPLVRQNTQDNCIPATIESIVKYHRQLTPPSWSNQTTVREKLIAEKDDISFPIAKAVLNESQNDFVFDVEDFGGKPSNDWVDRVDELVNQECMPVAFASVLDNPIRIHIRAIVGYDGTMFSVFDPGPGSVSLLNKQQIIDDIERSGVDAAGINRGPCRDILIIKPV